MQGHGDRVADGTCWLQVPRPWLGPWLFLLSFTKLFFLTITLLFNKLKNVLFYLCI